MRSKTRRGNGTTAQRKKRDGFLPRMEPALEFAKFKEELQQNIKNSAGKSSPAEQNRKQQKVKRKALLFFHGQAHNASEGKDIYDNSAAGAAVYREADSVLGWSVSDVCFNGPEEKLTESKYCQVAIFVTSMACLAAFHEKFGDAVKPVGAAGLSLGEYGALCCADYFSFADGLRLVARRAELMDAACRETHGTMAGVLTKVRSYSFTNKERKTFVPIV